ncbi:hypothetical protein AG1IA_03929 [Rhizoctonia solani AG-1 IA]|nr:hypothetical protein AG1IA_03929 [Rhizoctonia solani AG-1 IA]
MVNVMISRLVLNLRSCQAQSRSHHFVATPGGGLQVHVSIEEVELDGAIWKSQDNDYELDAETGSRTRISPSQPIHQF